MSNLIDVIALSALSCVHPIQGELAYATKNNLVGRVIAGYHADAARVCLLTPNAAHALCGVQAYLNKTAGLGLFIYDAYRPQRAVNDFIQWSTQPAADAFELQRKALHYPYLEKNQLFPLGYFSADSNHCYGNTVDLVLMDMASHAFVDMGAIFDFMDDISHLTATPAQIGEEAYRNRQTLVNIMQQFGFEPYVKEYWHFCHGGRAGSEVNGPLDIEITRDFLGKIK